MKTKMNLARGGGASASKKLLAAIAVLAVAFVVFAAIPAVDVTGEDPAPAESTKAAKIGETEYATVADAITAVEEGQVIVLQSNVTESITISKNVTIDLNGFKLTNEASKATIVVESGKLIVNDSSTNGEVIQNGKGSYNAALFVKPGAKAELNGGFFNSTDVKAWYTLKNCGELTINGGVKVYNNSDSSSVIANGYFNLNDYNSVNDSSDTSYPENVSVAKMTINGGAYTGKCYVKNDDYGLMTVNGGEFTISAIKGAALMNAGTMVIGSADGNNVPVFKGTNSNAVVLNFDDPENKVADPGLLTVNAVKADEASVLIGIANGYTFGTVTLKDRNVWNGEIISVSNGTVLNGSLDIGGDKAVFGSIKAGTNGISIKAGSVVIAGDYIADSAGNITVTGDAKITGNSTLGDGVVLTVTPGATLTVTPGATLTVTTPVVNNGTVSVAGTVSGPITNNGTVEKVNGGDLNGATITGGKTTEKTDDSQKENINIAGIVKGTANVYDVDQIVTITGDTSLDYNAMLTINGTLVVKEGVTLTLKAGSKLVLDSNAVLDIQGNVIVEEKYDGEPAMIDVTSGTVYVYGTLDVNGTLNVTKGTLVVKQDGILNILDEGNFTAAPVCKVSVEKSGTLAIAGSTGVSTGVMTIDNAGTIVYNSDVKTGDTTINMLNGASLDVQKVTLLENGTITVEDTVNSIVLKATTVDDGSYTPVGTAYVAAVISGVKISETITAATATNPATYNMTISGNVAVDSIFVSTGSEDGPTDIKVAASMTVTGTTTVAKSGIAVADGLTVGKDVTLINAGKLDVKVAISAEKGIVENNGTVTVSDNGSIVTKTEVKASAEFTGTPVINAAKYVVAGATGEKDTLYYVSLDAALAAAASNTTKTITVLGEQTLTASAELVSGATLDVNGAAVTIGSGDSAADVVLTVKSGATVKGTPASIEGNPTITVKGTVFAEKKTDLKDSVRTALTYGADVYTEELDEKERPVRDGWAKWTNVATAMADPSVTIVKLTKELTLESDLTIPEGKTLDTNNQNVIAKENVTITVEGTLYINGSSTVTLTMVGTTPATTDKSATIVVKGLIQSDNEIDIKTVGFSTGGITLLGAYYQLDGKYCMTTVEKAAPLLSTVDGQTITIKGEDADKLSVSGDISFAGKSATEAGTIDVQLKDVTFSRSVALDNAKIKFPADVEVSGTFSNASGSVAFKGMTAAGASASDYAFTVASAMNDGTAVLTVKGSLTDIDSENKQTFAVTGAVTIDAATLNYVTVDGTLTVKSNSTIAKDLRVNGTISVSAGAKLDATEKATVLGTVTAAPATTSPVASAGEFSAKILYVGIEESNIYNNTAGSAVISGAITVSDYALVAPGSEIPEVFTTNAYKSTEFYKGDALYVTGYANAGAGATITGLIKNVKVTKDNVYFGGWKDDNGIIATTQTIGAVTKVIADFKTKIYTVMVFADAAVDNLYIDGNLMTNNGEGAFVTVGDSKLEAGAHTFTYTLRNGYSGTGTFKIISEGKSTINGSTLTLAGTPISDAGITVKLQLTGFTASGYVDPTPTPAPSTDDDDGLSITDYLLIVLVILIVIMAVIVAMRLMRS